MGNTKKSHGRFRLILMVKYYFIEHRKLGLGVFSSNGHDAEAAANRVVQLVESGVEVAQSYFDWRAEKAAKGSSVNIRNKSSQLYERFQFLLDLYEAKRTEPEVTYEVASLGRVAGIQTRRETEWLALAVVESFFSWTEHVFIQLAVLQGKCTTGDEVKDLALAGWKCKFKTALNFKEPELKHYYDELIDIRAQVRNFVAHGAFGKRGEAFLFHSDAGAVPVQLPHREGKHSYRFPSSLSLSLTDRGPSDHEAIVLMQDFIKYIRSGPLAPAWIYLDSGEDLVLTMAKNGKYKLAMTSEEAMQEFTEYMSYIHDIHANMDY